LKNFLITTRIETLIESPTYINTLRKNWDTFLFKISPLVDAFEWSDNLPFLQKYVFDASNAPVDNISWRSLKWAESMQEFDKEKYTLFRQIVDDMMLDKEMIPDFPSEPLHIWETWASNLIAARMVIKASKHEYGETANALWRGFVQPTVFDPCDIVFSHRTDRSYDPYMGVYEVANILGARYFKCPEHILNDPLYPAESAILQKGKQGYDGNEHEKTADIFHSEKNEPIRAWNALLSATYWSGTNRSETSLSAWEKAIDICKHQNWTDALDALVYQYNLYTTLKAI